jgi:exosortase K
MPSFQRFPFLTLLLMLCCFLAYQLLFSASVTQLRWLLHPVQQMVSVFCSIPFSFDPEQGYINEASKIAINKSCAGIQFLITICAMLLHITHTHYSRWIVFLRMLPPVLLCAYTTTIFANTIRIVCAIYIKKLSALLPVLSKPTIHEATGILVYGGALLVCYLVTIKLIKHPERYEKAL